LQDLLVLRQAAALPPVGVDDRLVEIHIEQADRALSHVSFETELLLDRGRQTGGRAPESSLIAVDDLDLLDLAHFA
jgi:hypothetical protein